MTADRTRLGRDLLASIDTLLTRLAAAEQVCILHGWTAPCDDSDTAKAETQAWMDWSEAYGGADRPADWADRIAVLARRRDEITAATLASIRADRARDAGDPS